MTEAMIRSNGGRADGSGIERSTGMAWSDAARTSSAARGTSDEPGGGPGFGRRGVRRDVEGLVARLRDDGARPARFALVGGLCGAVQLGLLALFLRGGLPAIPSNLLAFLTSAQLNFVLSDRFTWGDRRDGAGPARGLGRRWLAFHGSIAGTALLNQGVFLAAHLALPDVVASALGIGVAAVANFLLQDRLIFRGSRRRDGLAARLPAASVRPPAAPAFTVVNPPLRIDGGRDELLTLRRNREERPSPAPRPDGALPRVDVVIPVYNEERALAASIDRLHACLSRYLAYDWRIVIADNASTDGTLAAAHRLARTLTRVNVIHLDEKGRGRALKAAWLGSDADVLSYMDVDLSTDLAAFPSLVDAIVRGGSDLATGRRLGPGARVERRRPLREITSRGYNLLIALAFRPRFTDAQCGFKAISQRAARDLLPRVQDTAWFFDTELLLLADRRGYRIEQIPVHWVDDPDSRVDVLKTALADLKGLWRVKRTGC